MSRRGGGFCMWSLQFSSQGPLVGCLSLIGCRIIWRSFQAKDVRLTVSQFQGWLLGMQRWKGLRPCHHGGLVPAVVIRSPGYLSSLPSLRSVCTPESLSQLNPLATSQRNLWNANPVQLFLGRVLESIVGPTTPSVVNPLQHLGIFNNSFLLLRLSTCCCLYLECPCPSHSVFMYLLKCHFSRKDFSSTSRSFFLIKSITVWNGMFVSLISVPLDNKNSSYSRTTRVYFYIEKIIHWYIKWQNYIILSIHIQSNLIKFNTNLETCKRRRFP